jgi:hypothetical protein
MTNNREFSKRREQFGLDPKLGEGYHLRPADGVIREFMKELGIHPAEDAAKAPADPDMDWFRWLIKYWRQKRRGKSTLTKWTCGCQNIRVGTKEFHGQCTKPECGNVFVIEYGKTHNIYTAKHK